MWTYLTRRARKFTDLFPHTVVISSGRHLIRDEGMHWLIERL